MHQSIQLSDITKRFGSVTALENVNFTAHAGEVHALIGENGAGKSTLMKILSGVIEARDFQGQILIDQKPVHFSKPQDAVDAGISIIHQELSTFPHLTVAENFFVGKWLSFPGGIVDWQEIESTTSRCLKDLGVQFPVRNRMSDLSTGQQQMVEIAKSVYQNSSVIIFDEPTSSLSHQESKALFEMIDRLKKQGHILIYISHRMEEIFKYCDRFTVLRDGKSVASGLISETNEQSLIQSMVGRSLDRLFPEMKPNTSNKTILEIKNASVIDRRTQRKMGPFSFSLKSGEILGFSGLLGSGRTELFKALFGDPAYEFQGTVLFEGKDWPEQDIQKNIRSHISWLSEDRKTEALFAQRPLNENHQLLVLQLNGLLSCLSSDENTKTQKDFAGMNVKYAHLNQSISELSGGNQQKIILSRILANSPKVIILDEPTRGVDVGAKLEIYQILQSLVEKGIGLILISSDLAEVMALSHRICVMNQGQLKATFSRQDFSQTKIMEFAIE